MLGREVFTSAMQVFNMGIKKSIKGLHFALPLPQREGMSIA